MAKIIIAHIPVLHEGYKRLLEAHKDFESLYILGRAVTSSFREIQKDIRILEPELVKSAVSAWYPGRKVEVIGLNELKKLAKTTHSIVMPDEDISQELAHSYFSEKDVLFYQIFLRWDRQNSMTETSIDPDVTATEEEFDTILMNNAYEEGLRSSDIWRRVGALIVKEGKVIAITHNQAMPHEHVSWVDGDPRNNYKKGVGIEMSTFIHAEAKAIAELAKKGVGLEGAEMYVTTFPCPPCAMLIANSGIKKLYYTEGYAILNGARSLKDMDVELIKVNMKPPDSQSEAYITYPESK